jgi:dihydroorotase
MITTLNIKKGNTYQVITKYFNDENHLNNYVKFMSKKGWKFIDIVTEGHPDATIVEAQENAYFDNFCILNNI